MTQDSQFQSKMVPGKPGSGRLFDEEPTAHDGPITCLGRIFSNDGERRAWFTEQLREKLKDPDFREIKGFPLGSDEEILTLSDPPYYTACPNPWLVDFIREWEAAKDAGSAASYHRGPFAADVSEGKYEPIYKYHPYPTKVPHKAIMRYILHYTRPGDIIYDGFCGTGMTGVAAQLCGDSDAVISLGYRVDNNGAISKEHKNENGQSSWVQFAQVGKRNVILNDLSPAAGFIAYNYNTPLNSAEFEVKADLLFSRIDAECSWMFLTKHSDDVSGAINYTVWSDVFTCPECSEEIIFWESAVDKSAGKVREKFNCPNCNAPLSKGDLNRAWTSSYDSALRAVRKKVKQVPVIINYSVGPSRFEKVPDNDDINRLTKINDTVVPHWFPSDRMMNGKETRRNDPLGLTHVHDFYSKRNLYVLATLKALMPESRFNILITKVALQITWLYRFTNQSGVWGAGGGPLSGTLYVPSLIKELNIIKQLKDASRQIREIVCSRDLGSYVGSTQSSFVMKVIPSNSVDYIFVDPPFGANLFYSELAFLWESWLNILTENSEEAVENDVQGKGLSEYRQLIRGCFCEAYRILKPGRWITVEFSNTKANVWNSIQTALQEAGFIVANVSALDKQKESFKAVTTPTAVKQDLVISAYKPNGGFEERFLLEVSTEDGVWDFVRTHLKYLPNIKTQDGNIQFIPERDPRILFDQVVSYYVRKGYLIPVATSQEFQAGLEQRFVERDGMYFLPEQAAEYDRAKMQLGVSGEHLNTTVVDDEQSAIVWLRARLKKTPQVYSDVQPAFMPMLSHLKPNERELLSLELLLNQNFLCYDGAGPVPEQIHAYLSSNWKELRNLSKDDPGLRAKARDRWYVPDPNKAGDLEKLRDKALLKEFDAYKEDKKKLKVFRLEAVRAGFKKAWADRDYATIVNVADKIPSSVLEEDPKLLMWYDQATTRMGDVEGRPS